MVSESAEKRNKESNSTVIAHTYCSELEKKGVVVWAIWAGVSDVVARDIQVGIKFGKKKSQFSSNLSKYVINFHIKSFKNGLYLLRHPVHISFSQGNRIF